MAQVKKTDLFQNNIFGSLKKQAEETNKVLLGLDQSVTDLAQSFLSLDKNIDKLDSKEIKAINEAFEASNKLRESTIKLEKEQKKVKTDLQKAEERLAKTTNEEAIAIAKVKLETQRANKELKAAAKIALDGANAYDELVKNTNEAQNEFKKLAVQFGLGSKEAKEAEKRFNELDKELRDVNEAAKDGRRDVGRYKDAIKEASQELNGFGDELDGAIQGIQKAGNVAKKSPLLLLGGIILGLGKVFQQTNEGGEEFAAIGAQITAVFRETVGRLGSLAKELKGVSIKDIILGEVDLFGIIERVFDGYLEALERQKKAAGEAARENFKLQRSMLAVNVELAKSEKEYEVLAQRAGDATITLEEQQRANVQAAKLNAQIAEQRQSLLQQEVDILEKRFLAAGNDAAAFSIQVELSQKKIELYEAEKVALVALAQSQTEARQIEQDQWEQRLDFLFDASDRQKSVNERILQDDRLSVEARKDVLKDLRDNIGETYDEIQSEIQSAANNPNFNLYQFAELEATEQAKLLKTLNLSISERNRLREAVIEYLAVVQDLEDAQKDLNEREAESKELTAIIALQRKAILDDTIDYDEQLKEVNKQELENQINSLEEGSLERLRLEKEYNDLILDERKDYLDTQSDMFEEHRKREEEDRKMAQAARLKELEEQAKKEELLREAALNTLNKLSERQLNKSLESIDKQLDGIENRSNSLSIQAANGNRDAVASLKDLEEREIELERKREQALQRRKRDETILAGLKIAAANAESTASPDLKALQVIAGVIDNIPSFFVGTERTGRGDLDNKGGFNAILHPDEKVFNHKDARKIGFNHDNSFVADTFYKYRTGQLVEKNNAINLVTTTDKRLLKAIEKNNDLLEKLPSKLPTQTAQYDEIRKEMRDVVQQGLKRTVKVSKGGVFS